MNCDYCVSLNQNKFKNDIGGGEDYVIKAMTKIEDIHTTFLVDICELDYPVLASLNPALKIVVICKPVL